MKRGAPMERKPMKRSRTTNGAFDADTRELAAARAGFLCEICGVNRIEQWHHESHGLVGVKMCPDLVKLGVARVRQHPRHYPLTDFTREGLAVDATRQQVSRTTRKGRGPVDPEKRFVKFLRQGGLSDHRPDLGPCIIFTGADNGNGYGQFSYILHGRRGRYAHRYAWERINGRIPDGLTIDHLCRVRKCVNANHMELVTRVENYLRAVAVRTHCPNGHEYTRGPVGAGEVRCLICHEAQVKRSGFRRTLAHTGGTNKSLKYDVQQRDQIARRVATREISVAQGAAELGCPTKYMDKLARRERRAMGLPDILKRRSI